MRKIDGKFHIEIGAASGAIEIVKTSNGEAIPEDEPLFLLRARDNLAVKLIEAYFALSYEAGCNEYHFKKLDTVLEEFVQFAKNHPERMKQPSITRGK